jgi:SAM-dependent methyltransferase
LKVCLSCGVRFKRDDWQCDACGVGAETLNGIISFSPDLAHNNEGFNPELFEQLVQVEGQNFWFCARNELIFWVLGKYFPQSRSFLEIGCGTGFVLAGLRKAFPRLLIAGSEIYTEGLKFAASRVPDAFLFQTDARCIPYDSEFDVIGAFDVIEHIDEDEAVLKQMYKALQPNGGIVLTVPQHPFLWSKQDEFARHVRRYSRAELVDKVHRAGLEVTAVTSFVSLLLPLMMASRFLMKDKMPTELTGEFKLGKHANRLLMYIMALERLIIKAGVSFPMGGSILLVARKTGNKGDEYPI